MLNMWNTIFFKNNIICFRRPSAVLAQHHQAHCQPSAVDSVPHLLCLYKIKCKKIGGKYSTSCHEAFNIKCVCCYVPGSLAPCMILKNSVSMSVGGSDTCAGTGCGVGWLAEGPGLRPPVDTTGGGTCGRALAGRGVAASRQSLRLGTGAVSFIHQNWLRSLRY